MTLEERVAARVRCENPPLGPWTERKPLDGMSKTERRLHDLKTWAAHARTDLPAALDALEEAEARISELEADKARLDWLEENLSDINVVRDLSRGNSFNLEFCWLETGCQGEMSESTLRAAVDAAMKPALNK